MAKAIDLSIGGTHRCVGALAVGEVVGNSETVRERFMVDGGESINVRFKATVTSDPQFAIIPQNPTIGKDDVDTGNVTAGVTAAANITTATETIKSYTLLGERYVDVVITSDSGDIATVTFVDVYVKRV